MHVLSEVFDLEFDIFEGLFFSPALSGCVEEKKFICLSDCLPLSHAAQCSQD